MDIKGVQSRSRLTKAAFRLMPLSPAVALISAETTASNAIDQDFPRGDCIAAGFYI